jgi:hypothetical protein
VVLASGSTTSVKASTVDIVVPTVLTVTLAIVRLIDVTPKQVVDDIDAFFRKEGAEPIRRFQLDQGVDAWAKTDGGALDLTMSRCDCGPTGSILRARALRATPPDLDGVEREGLQFLLKK